MTKECIICGLDLKQNCGWKLTCPKECGYERLVEIKYFKEYYTNYLEVQT